MENTLSNQPNSGSAGGDDALSFEDGIGALESLIDPSEEDQSKAEDQPEDKAVEEDPEEEEAENSEVDDESEDEDVEQDDQDQEDPEENDGESLLFDDSLKVEYDGEETTLGKLVDERVQNRVADFQRDYTKKTQEVSEFNNHVTQQAERVESVANQIREQRDAFLNYQAMYAPQEPPAEMATTDPFAYQQQKAYFDEWQRDYSNFRQAAQQDYEARQQEQLGRQHEYVRGQTELLYQKMPELKDAQGYQAFKQEFISNHGEHYGFTAQDVDNISDHRFAVLVKDAMAYRDIKKAAPEASKKLEGKPQMLRGKSKAPGKSKKVTASKRRQERLAKEGSMDSAIDALMDFDL